MLNLFVAVIMDNFDYLTRDPSILGAHHLDEFIQIWAEYDPSATGKIPHKEMYEMLRNMDPPLGFGNKCPYRLAYKKLIRMNMPIDDEGKVHFTTTLFSLIRENLSIKMRHPSEMDQADAELRITIKKLWPIQARKHLNLIVPPDCELRYQKLTVGKVYAGYLIVENWRQTRFGQIQPAGFSQLGLEFSEVVQAASRRGSLASDEVCLRPNEYRGFGRSRSPSPCRFQPRSPPGRHPRSPSLVRSPSPRRGHCYDRRDLDFSDAVSDVVDFVKHDSRRIPRPGRGPHPDEYRPPHIRSQSPNLRRDAFQSRPWVMRNFRSESNSPDHQLITTRLNTRSRSPSPHGPTSAAALAARRSRLLEQHYYTTSLDRRSRSPSPHRRAGSSYPTIPQRRGGGRRLPPTPNKPSTLHLGPQLRGHHTLPATKSPTRSQPINFPKLNASPTHMPKIDMPPSFRERRSPPLVDNCPRSRLPTPKILPPAGGGPRRPPLAPIRDQYPYERRPEEPLSFEQAVAIGRGSRQLPSPAVPNGYKPGRDRSVPLQPGPTPGTSGASVPTAGTSGTTGLPRSSPGVRHSDSDEDDWC